jgi:hypothetical protein
MLPENLIQVISSDAQEERQGAASPASVGEGAWAAVGGRAADQATRQNWLICGVSHQYSARLTVHSGHGRKW